jgi:NADH:ubiquinone oxidoreductase subunit F (NADH-binding)
MSTVTTTGPLIDARRLLAAWDGSEGPISLDAHLDCYGPLPRRAFAGLPGQDRLRAVAAAAGLRGRGGAGFPTGTKLAAVAEQAGRPLVVVNACEGDPTSAKDQTLLEIVPHLVLDGIELAAHAVNANEAVICLHRGHPAGSWLAAALRERGEGWPCDIRVAEVPPRFVASEESALVNFLTTGDARPTVTPPRPAQRGVDGRPTLVDNVETLAHLALIARYGADWFREFGTDASPGSTLVTLRGAVRRPGVYEVAFGRSIAELWNRAGGPTEPVGAVLVGGLGGSWLRVREAARLRLTHEDLRSAGAALGVAALVMLPERACGLAETARVLRYLAAESAGQCGPCMFGLPAVAADLTALAAGTAEAPDALRRLRRRLGVIPGRGACAHPDGAVRLAASALQVFGPDVAGHARRGRCAAAGQAALLPVPEVGRPGGGAR